jgi:site-specific DNA recombinase
MISNAATAIPVLQTRAVLYARFSSDMQREESIEAQIRAMREFAEKKDYVIVDEYIDRAKSATTDRRPEFQRMIKESARMGFDIVLVHKLDRFARNRYDAAHYRHQLRRNHIELRSVVENLDSSPESIILESVLEGMAEYYSKNLAREVEKGKRENALQGKHVGGTPPLGYDLDRTTMKLVINEHEAACVRLIFRMALDGKGYDAIIKELNERGYRTKRNGLFGANSIHDILKNQKYTGVFVYNRSAAKDADGKRNGHAYKNVDEMIFVEGAVPQIVSKSDFDTVQRVMSVRTNRPGAGKAKRTYLLSGKIVCGLCGSLYNGNCKPDDGRSPTYTQYRCSRFNRKIMCTNKTIRREVIEALVLEKLAERIFDDNMIPRIVNGYRQFLVERDADAVSRRDSLKASLEKTKKELRNLVSLMAKSGSDTMLEMLRELESQKAQLEYDYKSLCEELKCEAINEEEFTQAFRKARSMLKSGELSTAKLLVERFIQQVVLYDDRIEIAFNFGLHVDPLKEEKIPQNPPSTSNSAVITRKTTHKRVVFRGGDRANRTRVYANTNKDKNWRMLIC